MLKHTLKIHKLVVGRDKILSRCHCHTKRKFCRPHRPTNMESINVIHAQHKKKFIRVFYTMIYSDTRRLEAPLKVGMSPVKRTKTIHRALSWSSADGFTGDPTSLACDNFFFCLFSWGWGGAIWYMV